MAATAANTGNAMTMRSVISVIGSIWCRYRNLARIAFAENRIAASAARAKPVSSMRRGVACESKGGAGGWGLGRDDGVSRPEPRFELKQER